MLLHEPFFEVARRHRDAIAIDVAGASLTYGEAADRVSALANGLCHQLPAGARVAIHTYKSSDTILIMLACLRAGMTYVPLDPASPLQRRHFMLRDSQAQALVLDNRTAAFWEPLPADLTLDLVVGPPTPDPLARHHLSLDTLAAPLDHPSPLPSIRNSDLAYILYTSGSTGTPKGVCISHQNAIAFVDWGMRFFDIAPGDRVAVHAALHFDLPVFDIYVGLGRGAKVCPIDEQTLLFPEAVLRFLREQRISVLYAVPSALIALLNRSRLSTHGLPDLRLLLYAGEEFPPTALAKLMAQLPHTRVYNLYGPIETNVVSVCEVTPAHLSQPHIPIGRPIDNTYICLIDQQGQQISVPNVEGEIIVSGPSVTPGYLNRHDLTAATQISLASGRATGYRTGDFGYWDTEGVLHFLGRRDDLIKTRGFRVELGEVEAALMSYPQIAHAAVVARPHPDYTNLLYAFVVPQLGAIFDPDMVAVWCKQTLAPYMVPAEIRLCDHLPTTSTGKIARRELLKELDK